MFSQSLPVEIRLFKLFVILFLGSLSSCALLSHSPMTQEMQVAKINALKQELLMLTGVPVKSRQCQEEAEKLARIAVVEGENFAQAHRVVRPAWFNNCLVNTGLRSKGLCWQYGYHLFAKLHHAKPQFFTLRACVRDLGDYYHEHHAVCLSAKNQTFENSLVLDAWQDGGRLIHFRPKGGKKEWFDDPGRTQWLIHRLQTEGYAGLYRDKLMTRSKIAEYLDRSP